MIQGGIYRGTIHVPSSPRASISAMATNLYGSPEKLERSPVAKLKKMLEDTLVSKANSLCTATYLGIWWQTVDSKLSSEKKLPSLLGFAYNTLDSLSRKFKGSGDIIRLAASTSLEPLKGEKSSYLSIYALIGVLGELLSSEDDDLHQTFSWLAQQRVYPTPPWLVGASNTGSLEIVEDKDEEDSGDGIGEESEPSTPQNYFKFTAVMEHWIKTVKSKGDVLSNIPPYIYSRIMARLFFTLERMDTELSSKDLYTGNVLHRQIVAFMNAVLVEEMRTQENNFSRVILSNPTTSDNNFINNYNSVYEKSNLLEATPLFQMMFSCPLFGMFMSPTVKFNSSDWRWLEKQAVAWSEFCSRTNKEEFGEALRVTGKLHASVDEIVFENLWAPLNTVPLLGPRTGKLVPLLKPIKLAKSPNVGTAASN